MPSDDLGGGARTGASLRASDAERDVVATELGEHFQAGRLDQAEFDERLSAALGARTRGDLDVLMVDLPRLQPATGPGADPALPAAAASPARPGAWLPLALPLLFAVLVAAAAGHSGAWHPAHHAAAGGPWPLLWLWWLIPVALLMSRRHRARGDRG